MTGKRLVATSLRAQGVVTKIRPTQLRKDSNEWDGWSPTKKPRPEALSPTPKTARDRPPSRPRSSDAPLGNSCSALQARQVRDRRAGRDDHLHGGRLPRPGHHAPLGSGPRPQRRDVLPPDDQRHRIAERPELPPEVLLRRRPGGQRRLRAHALRDAHLTVHRVLRDGDRGGDRRRDRPRQRFLPRQGRHVPVPVDRCRALAAGPAPGARPGIRVRRHGAGMPRRADPAGPAARELHHRALQLAVYRPHRARTGPVPA